MNAETRQLLVLCLLAATEQKRLPAEQIEDFFSEPGDRPESAHRRFSRDLELLKQANLVSYESLRNDSDVRLVSWTKDPELHLTVAEHRALQSAREKTGDPTPVPGRVQPAPGLQKLAVITALLRCLEESSYSDVDELAGRLGVRPSKIRQLIERLAVIKGGDDWLALEELEIERSPDPGRSASPTAAGIRQSPDPDAPLNGVGLDTFGLFAYGRLEVDDRLRLITEALGLGTNHDERALRSAERKLNGWKSQLQQLEQQNAPPGAR